MSLLLHAHAKINLTLRVLGKRPDGYHDLQTVFQSLALHDTLSFERTRGAFSLDGDAALMPLDATNLIWKAADALWRAAGQIGKPAGARIVVRKRIPAQAGLGGGSSDAAATLVGLNEIWKLRLAPADLRAIAPSLGADVPYFLVGGTALALGRGEELFPLVDRPDRYVLLVVPAFGISTADAYCWLDEARAAGEPAAAATAMSPAAAQAARKTVGPPTTIGGNDLEPIVVRRHPDIAAIRDALLAAGAEEARMSGSGSAVFGLFSAEAPMHRARRALDRPGWTSLGTRTRRRTRAERERVW